MWNVNEGPPTKLLIVDDDPSIRDLLSETLTEIGFLVRSAEDGPSALAEIRGHTRYSSLRPQHAGYARFRVALCGPQPLSLDSANRDERRIFRR